MPTNKTAVVSVEIQFSPTCSVVQLATPQCDGAHCTIRFVPAALHRIEVLPQWVEWVCHGALQPQPRGNWGLLHVQGQRSRAARLRYCPSHSSSFKCVGATRTWRLRCGWNTLPRMLAHCCQHITGCDLHNRSRRNLFSEGRERTLLGKTVLKEATCSALRFQRWCRGLYFSKITDFPFSSLENVK